jgi:serine phosphatase RsbU (regulator of sigma subunit)
LYREVTKNLNQKKIEIMYLRIFLFLFLIFISPKIQSQNTIADSIINKASKTNDDKIKVDCYNALFLQFEYSDTIKAHNYLEKAQKIAIQNNYYNGLADNYLYYGYFEEDKGNTTGALSYYKKSLNICQNNGLDKKLAQVKTAIGNSYFQKGDYPLALKNYLYALKFQTKEKNEKGMAASYGNIGMVYSNLNNFDEALKYYNLSIKVHQKLNNKSGLTTLNQNLGNLYAKNSNYVKALEYFNAGLIISTELNDIPALANINSSIGMVKALTGNYEEAQINYANSLQFLEQYGNQNGIAVINCNLGEVFIELKQYNKANLFLEKSIKMAKTNGDRECLKNAYIALTKLDSLTGNFKGAFENYRNHIAYRDSLINEQIQANAKASLLEFEYEKKQAIAKAEHQKEIENERALAEESSRKQNIIILFVTIGLITLLVFVLIISFSLKKTKNQNIIIETQKIEVEIKNKEITDSINYARRIQRAILPPHKYVQEILPESFIFYRPKDIVAGDFYWLEEINELILLAACDCTGHGVPGAMVSVVCNNGLNRSLREYELTDPGKLLDKTREIIIQEFEKSEEDVKDGMDVSLVVLNLKNLSLSWAGANNPLWIIRNNEIIEFKPNKQPIGKYSDSKPFTTHDFKLMKGDSIYLFTDGFVDQFGGEKSKKYKTPNFKNLLLSIQNQKMDDQKNLIENEFKNWCGNLEQNDDVCVIGFRI